MRSSKVQKANIRVAPQLTTEDPELATRFNRVLEATVEAMENSKIQYAFIGGIASGGLGRPRSTRDIDLFVRPEDSETALRALAAHGFETEKTDPAWLYKAYKEDILVDIIFKSKGEIYLDQEMVSRMTVAEFHGRRLKLISPEDLLIIKAVAHSELTPGHWHDAIALLFHAHIDWEYLIKRARRAPRRVLSLLLYAQSVDIAVPNSAIRELYESLYGERIPEAHQEARRISSRTEIVRPPQPGLKPIQQPPAEASAASMSLHQKATRQYDLGHLREKIAEDSRTHEIDIQLEQEGNKILLSGRVCEEEKRQAILELARESFPMAEIENRIKVIHTDEPDETEVIA